MANQSVMPKCRYSIREVQLIRQALEDLSKHEEYMKAYHKGFTGPIAVARTQDIIDKLDTAADALTNMILYDICE